MKIYCMLCLLVGTVAGVFAQQPVVFAPGVVSGPGEEVAATFMPDGKTVYFAQGVSSMNIYFSKKVGGEWGKPQVAAISGKYSDWDPFLSPDGRQLYFVSNRPLDAGGDTAGRRPSHIWRADRIEENGWSEPVCLPETWNRDGIGNYAPTVSRLKDLFFFSPRRDKAHKAKSYFAKWLGDHYGELTALMLNGEEEVSDPCISPDERYIIFVSGNELFVSYRSGDGWGRGEKLGIVMGGGSSVYDPTVSPDGKLLYFTSSSGNEKGDIFVVPIHLH